MLQLKKLTLAVLAISSTYSFAGTMGDKCMSGGNVTVPCESRGIEFGGRALYLQPVYDYNGSMPRIFGTGTNVNANEPSFAPSPTYQANWAWGFALNGEYHFDKGTDAHIDWYHANHATVLPMVYQNVYVGDTQFTGYENVSLHPEWDAVNVTFGKLLHIDEKSSLHYFAGVEYARIYTGNNSYTPVGDIGDGNDGIGQVQRTARSVYNGFGPRGGIDLSYQLPRGLSVYANGAGGLLIGTAGVNAFTYLNNSADTNNRWSQQYGTTASNTLLVPELEAKLGLKYEYILPAMNHFAENSLTLDTGWLWINYFNAQQMAAGNISTPYYSPVATGTLSRTNFSLQGLYFGLDWKGDF